MRAHLGALPKEEADEEGTDGEIISEYHDSNVYERSKAKA